MSLTKVAVMLEAAFTVTTQVPVPVQLALPVPKLHPANAEPVAGAAVSVTTVPPK